MFHTARIRQRFILDDRDFIFPVHIFWYIFKIHSFFLPYKTKLKCIFNMNKLSLFKKNHIKSKRAIKRKPLFINIGPGRKADMPPFGAVHRLAAAAPAQSSPGLHFHKDNGSIRCPGNPVDFPVAAAVIPFQNPVSVICQIFFCLYFIGFADFPSIRRKPP